MFARVLLSFFLTFLVSFIPILAADSDVKLSEGHSRFMQEMLHHREEFIATAKAAKGMPEAGKLVEEMYQLLEKSKETGVLSSKIVNSLDLLGRYALENVDSPRRSYYTSSSIVACMVLGLNAPWDPDSSSSGYLRKYLYEHGSPQMLRYWTRELIAAAQRLRKPRWLKEQEYRPVYNIMLRLLARTDSYEAALFIQQEVEIRNNMYQESLVERQKEIHRFHKSDWDRLEKLTSMPKKNEVPAEIRARLWDDELMLSMVERFMREKNPETKLTLTKQLGEIGSPECAYALACDLRNPLILYDRSWNGEVSIRIHIMEALGRMYPQEPLFNEVLQAELKKENKLTDEEKKEFYPKRERWCEKHFNIEWKHPRPAFYIGYSAPYL